MGVSTYLSAISNGKGMAKSNLFAVYFSGNVIDTLSKDYNNINSAPTAINPSSTGSRVLLMCDEVSLPGVQTSTGTTVRYAGGAPINYPTNPIYNDLQLSFMCDTQMKALQFLNDWFGQIYTVTGTGMNRSYRLNYPEQYRCKEMFVEKRDRTSSSEIGTVNAKYTLYDAWPYSIDQIPLSYGSSQLVKVTANFYYTNWDVSF